MNTTPKCAACGDTGKLPGSNFLDCSHCDAAQERVAMDAAALDYIQAYEGDLQYAPEDVRWFVHQRARQIEREAQAARIADLEDRLRRAETVLRMAGYGGDSTTGWTAPSAPAVEQQPVAYLRFRAAQQWSGVGGHDIEHNEWLETCHAHEIGDDKMPAFPVYAAPKGADTDKVREAIPDGCALSWNGTIYHGISEIYHQMEEGAALHMVLDEQNVPRADKDGCVYSLVGRVEQYVAASMAVQAPVREVPGWQPIETAPTEGLIDVLLPNGKRWCGVHYDRICNEWRLVTECGKLLHVKRDYATHWMPVPALPAAPVQPEGEKP